MRQSLSAEPATYPILLRLHRHQCRRDLIPLLRPRQSLMQREQDPLPSLQPPPHQRIQRNGLPRLASDRYNNRLIPRLPTHTIQHQRPELLLPTPRLIDAPHRHQNAKRLRHLHRLTRHRRREPRTRPTHITPRHHRLITTHRRRRRRRDRRSRLLTPPAGRRRGRWPRIPKLQGPHAGTKTPSHSPSGIDDNGGT